MELWGFDNQFGPTWNRFGLGYGTKPAPAPRAPGRPAPKPAAPKPADDTILYEPLKLDEAAYRAKGINPDKEELAVINIDRYIQKPGGGAGEMQLDTNFKLQIPAAFRRRGDFGLTDDPTDADGRGDVTKQFEKAADEIMTRYKVNIRDPNYVATVTYLTKDTNGNGIPDASPVNIDYGAIEQYPEWKEGMDKLKDAAAEPTLPDGSPNPDYHPGTDHHPEIKPIISLLDRPLEETLRELRLSKQAFAALIARLVSDLCAGCVDLVPIIFQMVMVKTGLNSSEMAVITAYGVERLDKKIEDRQKKLQEITKSDQDPRLVQAEYVQIQSEMEQFSNLRRVMQSLFSISEDDMKAARDNAQQVQGSWSRIVTAPS